MIKRLTYIFFIGFFALISANVYGELKVKVRDIAYIDGVKENQVIGFGLVVGLGGTGDSKLDLTKNSLKNFLKNLGLPNDGELKAKNVAAVVITAKLPSFARVGDKVDVTVSSIGDAKSLKGGILVQSPLKGADNITYMVAQGPLVVAETRGKGKAVKTVGSIKRGGIVENSIEQDYINNNSISLVLENWDFTVANEIINNIKEKYPDSKPVIDRNGKIKIVVSGAIPVSEFISEIENIEVTPVTAARVVVDEKEGTIVMGGDVKISEALISKDGMTVRVNEFETRKVGTALLKESSTVKDLVDTLNFIGLSTTDMISVLKALKDAGALHAELIIK